MGCALAEKSRSDRGYPWMVGRTLRSWNSGTAATTSPVQQGSLAEAAMAAVVMPCESCEPCPHGGNGGSTSFFSHLTLGIRMRLCLTSWHLFFTEMSRNGAQQCRRQACSGWTQIADKGHKKWMQRRIAKRSRNENALDRTRAALYASSYLEAILMTTDSPRSS